MPHIQTRRLTPDNIELARHLFQVIAAVFEEPCKPVSDEYLHRLLSNDDFWAIAAFVDDRIVGGLTAYNLPMVRAEFSEIFIYDIAVQAEYQRRGIGRQLITTLHELAQTTGIGDFFVAADNEDDHALEFYQALGGVPAPVTIFTFSDAAEGSTTD